MRPARDSWINPALALCACTLTGLLFTWLKLPLPWMIGPLVAMAAGQHGRASDRRRLCLRADRRKEAVHREGDRNVMQTSKPTCKR